MGRKISNPSKGLYIEVQTTNIGEISTKRFILKKQELDLDKGGVNNTAFFD